MSKLETNQVDSATGTTLTLGTSGDTVDIPSGVTFDVTGATVTGLSAGITEYDIFRLTATITSNSDPIQSNLERVDDATFSKIGTGMTLSSGVFSFPSTGLYQVGHFATLQNAANDTVVLQIYATANNGGAWDLVVQSNYANGSVVGSGTANKHTLVNVTDTSNVKVKQVATSIDSGSEIIGNTDFNYTAFYFMRVGDSQ